MFAPGDFGNTPTRPPSIYHNRVIGALVLLVCAILCLILVFTLDQRVFIPYNATRAITQTWQAQHPTTPTRRALGRRTNTPRPINDRPANIQP